MLAGGGPTGVRAAIAVALAVVIDTPWRDGGFISAIERTASRSG
jgi:hypothetical protein